MGTSAPVTSGVQDRFLSVRREGHVLPAFHGTSVTNHRSIFERGLLVPGAGNGVSVANGSAHGVGIYTATVDNARLSKGFCRGGNSMLVCAVVSDAIKQKDHLLGNHIVSAESGNVRHVGSAMV